MRYFFLLILLLSTYAGYAQYEALFSKPYAETRLYIEEHFVTNDFFWQKDTIAVYSQIDSMVAAARANDNKEFVLAFQSLKLNYKYNNKILSIEAFIQKLLLLDKKMARAKLKYSRIDLLFLLSVLYHDLGKFGEAFECQEKCYVLLKATTQKEYPLKKYLITDIGALYYSFGDYVEAQKYLLEAAAIKTDLFPHKNISLYTTLGLINRNLNKYDSAIYYFNKALVSSEQYDERNVSITKGNMGITYYLMGEYDAAIPLLEVDIKLSLERNDHTNAFHSLICLADVYRLTGRFNKSRELVDNALSIREKVTRPFHYMPDLYVLIGKLYKQEGNYRAAYKYADSFKIAQDTLNSRKHVLHLVNARHRVDIEKRKRDIAIIESERALSVQKRNSIIILLGLILIIGVLFINRQRIRQKKLHLEKQYADDKLKNAQLRLASFTKTIHEKNQLLETSTAEINKLRSANENDELPVDLLYQLQKSTILTDDEWNDFRALFEQVHSGYISRLMEKLPLLTPSEVRFIVLSKLKFSNKEIAAILGISPATCRIYKSRLLKKLSLQDSDDFVALVENT